MRLRHATPVRNLPSILRRGLLTCKSRGRLPVVWLVGSVQTTWALLHVVQRHRCRVEAVVIIEVDVPRKMLRRSQRGLWYCTGDVPPASIRHVVTFNEVASSPLQEIA